MDWVNPTQGMIVPIVIALLSGIIPGVIAIRQANKKASTDAQMQYYSDIRKDVDAAGERIDKLQARYDELREDYDVLREDFTALNGYVSDLEGYIDVLLRLVQAAGLAPPPRPKRPIRKGSLGGGYTGGGQ